MEYLFNQEMFDDLIYKSEYGKEDILKEEFIKALNGFKTEIKFLSHLYNKQLCKDDFENIDIGTNYSNFNLVRKRIKDKSLIQVIRTEGKKEYFIINHLGKEYLKTYFEKEFLSVNPYVLENVKSSRKQNNKLKLDKDEHMKEMISEVFQFVSESPDLQRAILKGAFEFDINEILENNPVVGEALIENFAETIELFRLVIKEEMFDDSEYYDLIKDNIKIKGLETIKTQNYKISTIPKETKEFISVKGMLCKKNSHIREEVFNMFYLCTNESCEFSKEEIKTPGISLKVCPRCKSHVECVRETRKACLNLEVADLESENNIKVKVYDKLKDEFMKVKVGDELVLFGHIEYLKCKNKNMDFEDKHNYERVFILNSFYQSNEVSVLKKEDFEEMEALLTKLKKEGKTPRDFILEPFEGQFPYPKELDTFMLLPQVQKYTLEEDICHPLLIGSSGCGKSTYKRTLDKVFPKAQTIELKQLSEAKFYGGIKNDKVTDIGLCMKFRGGSLTLDECDKDKESYDKGPHMLNEVLGQQTATKEKIGVSIKIDNTNLRVCGIMNPDPQKKKDAMAWALQVFHESTINRFFLINFDHFMKPELEDMINENSVKGGLLKVNGFDLEIRKKLILYLRESKIDISEIIDDLILFQKNFKNVPLKYPESTTRNLRNLKNIIIAICRLNGESFAKKEHLVEAINLLVWTLKTKGENLENFLFNNEKAEEIDL